MFAKTDVWFSKTVLLTVGIFILFINFVVLQRVICNLRDAIPFLS